MSGPRLFNATRWSLGSYDGETIGWLIGDASCLAGLTSSLEHVSDLVGELDTGDAPSYARGTIDVVTDQVGETTVLIRDPESSVPSTDTTGGTPAVVVFYDPSGGSDATDLLLSALPIAEGPGYSDWEVDPSSGIAAVYDNADLDDLAHGSLLGRTDPDQHPISAITGLATALADLGDAPSGLVGSVTVTPSSGVADVAAAVEGGAAGVVVNGVSESLTEITMPDPATTGPFTMIIAADAGILDSLTWTDDLVGEYDSGFFFPVDIGSGKENVAIRAIPGSASWLLSPILPYYDPIGEAGSLAEFLGVPDPTGVTDGHVWTAGGDDTATWEAPSGGGGGDLTHLASVVNQTSRDATAMNTGNGGQLIDTAIALPISAAGDLIAFEGWLALTNNSGAARNMRLGIQIGSTFVQANALTITASGSTYRVRISGSVFIQTTGAQVFGAEMTHPLITSDTHLASGVATEDFTSPSTLQLYLYTPNTTATQAAQLLGLSVWKVAA